MRIFYQTNNYTNTFSLYYLKQDHKHWKEAATYKRRKFQQQYKGIELAECKTKVQNSNTDTEIILKIVK
jgi:hypothetical protein